VNRALAQGGRRLRQVAAMMALAATLMVSGCATGKHTNGTGISKAERKNPGRMTVYVSGTNMEIVFQGGRNDMFAHTSWPESAATGTNFEQQLAVLTFEKQEPAVRRPVTRRGNRAAVRDAKEWQELVQKVFESLVPAETNHGVILLAQEHETLIYRDPAHKPKVVRLVNKPPEITVDRTWDGKDFSREIIQLLEQEGGAPGHSSTPLLFVTGEDPAFVLVEPEQKLLVFFSYPPDPETRPLEVPGWFALKALNTLLFKSYVVTAIKNPFTLVGRGLWHIGNSGATAFQSGSQSPEPPPPLYPGPGMDLDEWEKHLDESVSAKRYKGQIQCYIDGEKFFPALIQSIQDAKKSVDVLVFIFDVDDYAVKIADLLKARSPQVRVRVLMDEMGSLFAAQVAPEGGPPDFKPPSDIRYYLKAGSRVQVRAAANPWLTAEHRKCIIIDGRQAYVGGMNIGRDYRYNWHDMMVGLTGPVVGRLEKDYREAWAHAGLPGDIGYAWEWLFTPVGKHKLEMTNAIDIRPLRTATWNVAIYHAQLEAIQRAKRYIYIENAYFDDDTTLRELIRARRRGVDVRVILPSENDSGIMQTSNQVMANDLVRNGIKVYAYPKMTHVKAAIYDGWACVGSANFEKMSLRIAQELDVGFSDPTAVDELKRDLFEKDFKISRELTSPVQLNWTDFVLKAFADQF
jgi:cardiolipin synthase